MEEPRELTVEELEAEEIGELPERLALSLLRSHAGDPLPHPPGPWPPADVVETPPEAGAASEATTDEGGE